MCLRCEQPLDMQLHAAACLDASAYMWPKTLGKMCWRCEQALDMQQHAAACLDASAYLWPKTLANMRLRREQALDMQQHAAACLDASAYMQQHAWMRVHTCSSMLGGVCILVGETTWKNVFAV